MPEINEDFSQEFKARSLARGERRSMKRWGLATVGLIGAIFCVTQASDMYTNGPAQYVERRNQVIDYAATWTDLAMDLEHAGDTAQALQALDSANVHLEHAKTLREDTIPAVQAAYMEQSRLRGVYVLGGLFFGALAVIGGASIIGPRYDDRTADVIDELIDSTIEA